MLSGQNDAANARHARTLGAAEFVAKPCDPDALKKILLHALQFRAAEISGVDLADADPLIGRSPALQKLKSQISQYADSPFPALIEGESGTGKELVAELLHRLSWRRSKPWFALNCAAIAPTLVEPTLFGYTKGAFTGATQNKAGYFEDASDGTLFLDEIGELPLELQAKLPRVLKRNISASVKRSSGFSRARVIAAVTTGTCGRRSQGQLPPGPLPPAAELTISVPPLRDMDETRRCYEHFRCPTPSRPLRLVLDEGARKAWHDIIPGYVRELRNIVIRLRPSTRDEASAAEIELGLTSRRRPTMGPPCPQTRKRWWSRHSGTCSVSAASTWTPCSRPGNRPYRAAMKLTRGNVSQAAKMLGINRTTQTRMESLHVVTAAAPGPMYRITSA